MKIASRFLTRPEAAQSIEFTVDGEAVAAHPGDTVAAAMLAQSGAASRQSAQGARRTAFCMMGVCFDCLCEINGHPSTQACMTLVQNGMTVRRQNGLRALQGDVNDD